MPTEFLFHPATNPSHVASLRRIYYDFDSLGYIDKYGSACFCMASLVCNLLRDAGHLAEVINCTARVTSEGRTFGLGFRGFARAGQIDGHVVCVVDGHTLVDFGLGSVRNYFDPDYYRALVCPLALQETQLAAFEIDGQHTIHWLTDWQCPEVAAELIRQEPMIQVLGSHYHFYARNRIGYHLRKVFGSQRPIALLRQGITLTQKMH